MRAATLREPVDLPARPVLSGQVVLRLEDALAAGLQVRTRYEPLEPGDWVRSDDGYVALVTAVLPPTKPTWPSRPDVDGRTGICRRDVETTGGRFHRDQAVWTIGGRTALPQGTLRSHSRPYVVTPFGYAVDLGVYRFVRAYVALRDPWIAARLALSRDHLRNHAARTATPHEVLSKLVGLMGREDTRQLMGDSLREQFEAEGVSFAWAAKRLKAIAEDPEMEPKVALDAVKTVLKSLAPPREVHHEISATVQAMAALASASESGNPQLPKRQPDLRLIPAIQAVIEAEGADDDEKEAVS